MGIFIMNKRILHCLIKGIIAIVLVVAIVMIGGRLQSNRSSSSLLGAQANLQSSSKDDDQLEVHFFDVGEADSALVSFGEHYMLIDGGSPKDSSFIYTYLKEHGINHLDYIVCSHEHEDHVGGLAGALNYATVGTAFVPVTDGEGRAFESFVKYLKKQDKVITVPSPGDKVYLGDARVTFLGPVDMQLAENNPNNSSIILQIKYKKIAFLFTGDSEAEEEISVATAGRNLRCTVLKVAHHGSSTSSVDSFLKKARPKYCVISVGKDNSYGHPDELVVERLRKYANEIYRTDVDGEIVCATDGRKITVKAEKRKN